MTRILIWSVAIAITGGGYWLTSGQGSQANLLLAQSPAAPTGTTPVAPIQAAPVEPPPETGFLDILLSGGIVGNLIMLLLLALSLTAAYLVFEHAMAIRHKELSPPGVGDEVRDLLAAGNVKEAEKICHANPSFLSFVLLSGIAELDSGWSGVEKALEDSVAEQSARLFRKIEYLSVIGNIAPMVGLLGTVTGMIFAFQQVASTQGAAGAADLAEGIYQALVTTVGGLLVAIPSLGAFAVFRNWVDELVAECAYEAQQVFTPLKRRRRQAAAAPSGGRNG
ncbi:MotA/TolQ/ExbB proton channel family protein [Blastopirellula retiformator]|uniref:Biopolymer transport protein ExbB n=1 Tax=Blastopirellula retiformator TaxID=2527970 RepID=A0A5C5V2T8_9BACT|nr:MotA/TolQ/ExbB proton channel family protein [Blastopirellula retiformator]TWT32926.1 Biopolymer transport protein ExbB [Blastopirellula retiformator]